MFKKMSLLALLVLQSGLSLADEQMNISIWYSENNEWLALETEAGGRLLRYQLL